MKLVVDANIIFSLLIVEGKTAELFVNPFLQLYAPEFLLEEFREHKEEILVKTKRNEKEFSEELENIKQLINFISEKDIQEFIADAKEISPDVDDVAYFALALKLDCSIWSNDKKLKGQTRIKIYSTEDLVQLK
ncbi:MAG: hypothetical protein HYT16_00270 [DPANN group archaeon]|nr:hypothetical protein [DPANN group archaeon]